MTDLLKLKDYTVVDVSTDQSCLSTGCPTCGYGSIYVSEVTVSYKEGGYSTISCTEEHDFGLDLGSVLRVLLNGIDQVKEMTRKEFTQWFKDALESEADGYGEFNLEEVYSL